MGSDTAAAERKPRSTTVRIYAVVQQNGHRDFYRATSTTQAGAFHNEGVETRKATDDEIMEIGRRGLAVGGIEAPAREEDDAQLDAFSRHQMEAPDRED